jgi:protein-L-isoaspartate(D-aspartate) O-methyltransferase
MIEALDLGPQDTVLEIGTGYGYQAALLARLAHRVFSVERISELAQAARRNLKAEGVLNAEIVTADGTLGLPGFAPFDGIVVAAAFLRVPVPLAAQLSPGGKLVMPVGNGGGDLVKVYEARDGELVELRVLCGARFVPLLGENGFEVR